MKSVVRREDVELLAPAGDWDCMRAAVANGADAIFSGWKSSTHGHGRIISAWRNCLKLWRFCIAMGLKVF